MAIERRVEKTMLAESAMLWRKVFNKEVVDDRMREELLHLPVSFRSEAGVIWIDSIYC
mgnify:CR=1 FL=1